MANYLSIDFGTKRIGVAFSQGYLAEPLTILEGDWTKTTNWPEAVSQIIKIMADKEIDQVVIGISENKMADLTKQFALTLQDWLSLPIEYIDETLSSYQMHQNLTQAKKSKRNQPIDHLVAAALLQEWLDNR